MKPFSLYIHIPFCQHRCGYCDFNTYAGLQSLVPAYVRALCQELELSAGGAGERLPVHTIFFGGGTPSLLPIDELEAIFAVLQKNFNLIPEIEITLEANPGSVSLAYLAQLHELGVNRLSLGVQSANPEELHLLERQHDYPDVIRAVSWARQVGFDQLNLDLIFGLPEQPLRSWQRTLNLALDLHPEHFSLYALTLEHGTPFGIWTARGLLSEPDPDLAADMYEWASDRLAESGYLQYEISNWGMQVEGGFLACRHNLQYWRNLPYLGFGAGAHGYADGVRTANVLSPVSYVKRFHESPGSGASSIPLAFPCTPATQTVLPLDRQAEIAETMMMGLRLVQEGVSAQAFQERFEQSLEENFAREIERLIQSGLLEWAGDSSKKLRLTSKGRLLGNQVFMEFI